MRDGIEPGEKYSESVRSFCFKLHAICPRSYEYIRSEFKNNLPHISTIKSWYKNSNLDAEPGINQTGMAILEQKVHEMASNGQTFLGSLSFDEMSIREHKQWDSRAKQFIGNVTFGNDREAIANNAIVFLVNGINAKIQVPAGHHFITTLDGSERKELLLQLLAEFFKRAIVISNITFDGLPANALMCKLLGAELDSDEKKPYFIDPYSCRKIYIILDPSHCIKSVRNNLCNRQVFVDSEGGKIEWRLIKALVAFGEKNSFNLTHKLTNRHINFKNRKMHVRTATQTLSSSTANALHFLMVQNVRGFSDADPTIKFVRLMNTLFDVMNTHKIDHNAANQFKSALNFFNAAEIFDFLIEAEAYILGLKVQGIKNKRWIPVVKSRIKTGFRGFVINIETIKMMYHEFVEEHAYCVMIATYKLSQDHLEMLFCKIRYVHRFNDNPTVQQFKGSLKRIMMTRDMLISRNANVSRIEVSGTTTNLLTVSSLNKTRATNVEEEQQCEIDEEDWEEILEAETNDNNNRENQCYNAGISFVAFKIESRLLKADGCSACKKVLQLNDKVEQRNCVGTNIPCRSTFEITKIVDAAIKLLINGSEVDFNNKIIHLVMGKIDFMDLYPEYFESEHDAEHKNFLIRFIINEYIHLKCTYLSKQQNYDRHRHYFRHIYRKTVQRAGQ